MKKAIVSIIICTVFLSLQPRQNTDAGTIEQPRKNDISTDIIIRVNVLMATREVKKQKIRQLFTSINQLNQNLK